METNLCINTIDNDSKCSCIEKISNIKILISCESSIKLWNINENKCLKSFLSNDEITALKKLSETNFASGSYKEIKIWNLVTGQLLHSIIGLDGCVTSFVSPGKDFLLR